MAGIIKKEISEGTLGGKERKTYLRYNSSAISYLGNNGPFAVSNDVVPLAPIAGRRDKKESKMPNGLYVREIPMEDDRINAA